MMLIPTLALSILAGAADLRPAQSVRGAYDQESVCGSSQIEPIPFDFHRPIVVGEFHGTEQTEPLIVAIICQALANGNSATFAVEMPPTALDGLARPIDEDPFWAGPPDGRSSVAMHRLLERLRPLQATGALKVIGFRQAVPWPQLGSASADYIRRETRENDVLVVLSGNFHASRVNGGTDIQTLASALGDIVNIRIANSQPGNAWACVPACGLQELQGGSGSLPLGFNRVSAANGYDYFYVVDTYTASVPYKERKLASQ